MKPVEKEFVALAETGVLEKIKRLKIQPLIRCTRWESTTVPEIRLSGAWLEKLGFNCGERVEVRMSEGKLVITAV
ncbi:MAG: type I addiction module toxin, SymE family [Chitinophagaceae bacterium]|nr:MAG: type I addiction module toxin, SymE family [Chitinophagaceae bacterium]